MNRRQSKENETAYHVLRENDVLIHRRQTIYGQIQPRRTLNKGPLKTSTGNKNVKMGVMKRW